MANDKWIASAIKKPGSLHKALHIKPGETIPVKKLKEVEHSKNASLKKINKK